MNGFYRVATNTRGDVLYVLQYVEVANRTGLRRTLPRLGQHDGDAFGKSTRFMEYNNITFTGSLFITIVLE